jgi:adenosylmethionine-8-amino-7-oxononanoate aminotransferase
MDAPLPGQSFWHPFSQRARSAAQRVTFVSGDGSTLVDSDGREYLDATAALWYALVGHGRTEIATAIGEQAARLAACSCFDVYASDRTLQLADRVAEMVPLDDPKVFFTSGGSDSVDTALKVARRYFDALGRPEKRVILYREQAYHGMHAFGTSVAGISANRDGYGELVAGTASVGMFDLDSIRRRIAEFGPEQIAALILEPVIGAGGVHPPPNREFLIDVARLCAENEILLIADEVVTAFGRTGAWFACERYGVRPDILILAKGLTSGYVPLGATVFSGKVVDPFEGESAPFMRHGYTYSGHATACAAGVANLDILEREALPQRVSQLEGFFRETLASLESLPAVREVRTVGFTAAVQLDGELDNPAAALRLADGCRERGVLTRVLAENALHVSPPLVISEKELEQLVEVMGGVFAREPEPVSS